MPIFGEYNGSVSPLMYWKAEYEYTRTSNSNIRVDVTVTGEIKNHASTSWMGTGNNVVVSVTVAGETQTYEIKTATESWRGSEKNPRSCSFVFNVASNAAGNAIALSYSVTASGYTAAAKVPVQSTSFASPALLYVPSTVTVGDSNAAFLGVPVTISTNRQYPNMTHLITCLYGENLVIVANNVEDSVVWTPPLDFAKAYPDSAIAAGILYCYTYIDGEVLGSTSTTVKFTARAEDFAPSCSLSLSLVPTQEPEEWGVAVQGYTKISADATWAGSYGSWIVSARVDGGGYTGTAIPFTTPGTLNTPGENKFTLTVTDSRGFFATASAIVNVLEYAPPVFESVKAYRANATGAAANNGQYIHALTSFSCSPIGGKNTVSCVADFCRVGTFGYSGESALESGVPGVLFDGVISAGASYTIRFTISDALQSVPYYVPIGVAKRAFHIKRGGTGAAFGKIAEKIGFVDSEWAFNAPSYHVNNVNIFELIFSPGSIMVRYDDADPNEMFPWMEWERIEDCFLLAAGSKYAAGTTGGESEHRLTVEEMPAHYHAANNGGTFYTTKGNAGAELNGIASGEAFNNSGATGGFRREDVTAYSGGDQPHNNMPPYLAVNVWRRTK